MIHGRDVLEHTPHGLLSSIRHPDYARNNASTNKYDIDYGICDTSFLNVANDFWLLRDSTDHQEDELYCFENSVAYSKGNIIKNTQQISFTSESKISHAFWCKFQTKNLLNAKIGSKKNDSIDCVCLLDKSFLKIFTNLGENFITNLQFKVSAVRPTKYGIFLENSTLPGQQCQSKTLYASKNESALNQAPVSTIYSLSHPLDDVCPVLLKHGTTLSLCGSNIQIIFTNDEPSFALVFDLKTGLHSIYKVRKCLNNECHFFENLYNSSTSFSTTSAQCMSNSAIGVRQSTARVNFTNLGLSLNSFRARTTSCSTTHSASISFSSQHLSRSYSPMTTRSRCQSPTNPVCDPDTNAMSEAISNQSTLYETFLAPSKNQLECKICTERRRSGYHTENSFVGVKRFELCLEHVWTESSLSPANKDNSGNRATKVFITVDLVGQNYLCYLIENRHRLHLIRIQKSNCPEQLILGLSFQITATNVVNFQNLSMLAVSDINGTVSIYSGPTYLGKLHFPSNICSVMKNQLIMDRFDDMSNSPYPRRSSLISPSRLSTPDTKFDDGVHLLSPVNAYSSDSNNLHYSPIDSGPIKLDGSIFNKLIFQHKSLKYSKISIPHMKACPIVSMCLQSLRSVLPRDLAMQLLIKWYLARNAPGPQDLTAHQEWTLFLVIFFTVFGYEVNKLNITMISDLGNTSENANQDIVPKKQKTINNGSVEDWSYLMASEVTDQLKIFLDDAIGLSKFSQESIQESSINIEPETSVMTKMNVESKYLLHLPNILLSLHLLYEEIKLKSNMSDSSYLLAKLLQQLSSDLNLPLYTKYYLSEFPSLYNTTSRVQINCIDAEKITLPKLFPVDAPSIYNLLFKLLSTTSQYSYIYQSETNELSKKLFQIFCKFKRRNYQISPIDQFFDKMMSEFKNSPCANKSDQEFVDDIIMHFSETGIDKEELDNLPSGIKFVFSSIINKCRETPPPDWPLSTYNLIDRQDLAALKKDMNINHKICAISRKNESDLQSDYTETNDGMNFDYTIFKLRFNVDHRVREVRKLLDSSKPVKISLTQRPDVSDHEFIEEQEKFLLALCTRTMSLSIGRGMFTLRTAKPVNTEQLPIPELCLSGKASPRGTTIELGHIDIPTNMNLWPSFHNGVATGLAIHPSALNVDSTWIVYNKQHQGELGIEHSGFLMALGLNGHLKNLAPFSKYEYLVECHEATSVGLLLGLSAAHRSSMDVSMTKLLSVHVETLLPPTSIELNVQQNVQVAALIGVGLVYQGTNHRHIAHALLSEIGRPPGPEMKNCVDRESYSLAAGLALGLVVLNSGGKTDLANIPDVLHYYMIGGKSRPFCGSQKDKYKSPSYQVREGDSINIDITSPGATVALGLMYLKSGNRAIAEWMSAPNTQYLLDFVRPDLLLLRILAKSLILWDDIEPSKTWVSSHVPEIITKYKLQKPNVCMTEHVDLETINQAYCNIIAGACMALGLKYAGTENIIAFKTLYHFLKMFMTLAHKSISELAGKTTIETCLNVVLLSVSIVMAGTGNLEVLRACRHLRTRVGPTNSVVTYGSHIAIHMALGFLFIGGGSYTLSNSPSSVAALIISLFPKFPTHSNDNRYHLQALRHFYVLAIEPRLILPKDIDSGKYCYAKIKLTYQSSVEKEGQKIILKAPCLLPQLDKINTIELNDDRYWKIVFEKDRNFEQLNNILSRDSVLYVKQRAGCLSYAEDPHGFRTLLARTLTTEDVIVWTASLNQIVSFTTNRTLLNFIERFLENRVSNNKVKCDENCLRKVYNKKNPLSFTNSKVIQHKKSDVYQIYDNTLRLSSNESHYLQTLIKVAYECVIRDKVNFLSSWIDFTRSVCTINKDIRTSYIWQIKFLYQLGISKDHFVGLEKLLNVENILANKQQICLVTDSWEEDIHEILSSNVKNGIISISLYKKVIAYALHYDTPDLVDSINHKKDYQTINRNMSNEEIARYFRMRTLNKK